MPPTAPGPRPTGTLQLPAGFALLAVLLSGCSDQESLLFPDGATVAEIRISPGEMVLSAGQTASFEVVLVDQNGREHEPGPGTPAVKWSSVDTGIAQVLQSGRVEGVGNGFTRVIASAGTVQAEATVIVQPQAEGIGFDGPEQQFEGIVGTPVEGGIQVRIEDASGAPVPGVTVRFSSEPGSGSLEPALAVTNAAGTTSASWTLGRRPGVHRALAEVPLPDLSNNDLLADGGSVAGAPPQSPKNPQQRLRGWAKIGDPEEVDVTPNLGSTEIDGAVLFEAVVRDKHGNVIPDAKVTWTSRDEDIASVDPETGSAQGRADGVAVIEAEIQEVTGTGTLVVGEGDGEQAGAPESLTISPANWTLGGVGDTVRLDAVARDADGRTVPDISVEWSSDNSSVATVSQEGLVTAQEIGTAIITAAVICTTSSCSEITANSEGEVEGQPSSDPDQVTDLRVVDSSPTSLTVEFTEVDDGTGAPANYALRYGTPTLSWGSAASTEVAIQGSEIGGTREYEVSSLNPETAYEFQLVAYRGTLGADATFGELSNKASDMTEGIEAGDPAWVTVSPSNVTIRGIGNTATLSADVRDADGNPVSNGSVEWSSTDPTVATVSDGGIVEASTLGTTLIIASVLCGTTACTDTAQIMVAEPSEGHPNEPAGFQPWFAHDWQSIPPRRDDDPDRWSFPYKASGVGYFTSQGHFGGADNAELIDDPNAPHGYGKSLRITIPEGHRAGSGVINWSHLNSDAGISSQVGLNPYYISYWILFEPYPEATQWSPGGDWEFGKWRTFTVNRHLSEGRCAAQDIGFSITGGYDFLTQSPAWWVWGNPDCSTSHTNSGDQGGMSINPGPMVGVWYHVEFLYESLTGFGDGDNDSQDVAIKIWINGVLELDRVYQLGSGNPMKQLHINNNASWSWGESSSPSLKDRADYLRISGIYVSGVPYNP